MPVESRDDLAKRLRDDVRQLTKMVQQASFAAETDVRVKDPSLLLTDLENAATRIEADAKRIAELEAEASPIRRLLAHSCLVEALLAVVRRHDLLDEFSKELADREARMWGETSGKPDSDSQTNS